MADRNDDNLTEVIAPPRPDGRTHTAHTEVLQARTPPDNGTVPRNRNKQPAERDDAATPRDIHRYKANSTGRSIGPVQGVFVPYSRETDYVKREHKDPSPRRRLTPPSPGNQTHATRTMTRDLLEPMYYSPRNPLRDYYADYPPSDHYPYDLPSERYPYFSYPEDDHLHRHLNRYPPEGNFPKATWSEKTNRGTKLKPPRRKAVSDPGNFETSLWIKKHGHPTKPGHWPYKIEHDPELNRDFLESPLGKRRYIGHVPGFTERDRWERQYWDYLVQRDVDQDMLEWQLRNRSYFYKRHVPIVDTSKWVRDHYVDFAPEPGMVYRKWWEREKEVQRQRERERYHQRRDRLYTRGSILAVEGSEVKPNWLMSENQRLKYLHDKDIAHRRDLTDRVWREIQPDDTSASQRPQMSGWTARNAPHMARKRPEYKNWQLNENWRYKKPRPDRKQTHVALWLTDQYV